MMSENQQFETEIDAGIPTAQRSETGVTEGQEGPPEEYDSVPMRFYPQWVKQVQTPEGRLPYNVARHPNITKETLPSTEREFWSMLEDAWLKTEGKSTRPQCAGTYNGTAWNCAGTAPAGQMNCHQCREAHARFMMDGCQPAMNY